MACDQKHDVLTDQTLLMWRPIQYTKLSSSDFSVLDYMQFLFSHFFKTFILPSIHIFTPLVQITGIPVNPSQFIPPPPPTPNYTSKLVGI